MSLILCRRVCPIADRPEAALRGMWALMKGAALIADKPNFDPAQIRKARKTIAMPQ